MKPTTTTLSILLIVSILTACGGTDRRAERRANMDAAGQGAIGGALIGATAGILLGDAELAAKGAAMGAVSGGVSGAAVDYRNDVLDRRQEYQNAQENERNATMAAAIAATNSDGTSNAPAGWRDIDAFVGEWSVTGTSVIATGGTTDFAAVATSRLDSTQAVSFRISDVVTGAGDSLPGSAYITLDYQVDEGFRLFTRADENEEANRFVGYYDNDSKRYVYFYAGGSEDNFTGISREDFQVHIRMVGTDVITAETVVSDGLQTRKIQVYKLTRK